MHEWRERAINQFNYGGDLLHIDFLTIPGASVIHLRHAWNVEYRKPSSKIPVDVLLLAGTNDLMQSSNATNVQSVLSDMQGCILFRIPPPGGGGGIFKSHLGRFSREREKRKEKEKNGRKKGGKEGEGERKRG